MTGDDECLLEQVEVTRFEDLEETHAEVKLKQTLWESQNEWAQDYEAWNNVSTINVFTDHFCSPCDVYVRACIIIIVLSLAVSLVNIII